MVRLYSGSYDKTIKVWEALSGDCLQTLEGHSDGVWSVCVSADGSRIYSGSDDNTIKVRNTQSFECLLTASADAKGNALALDLEKQRIVSITKDGWKFGGWRYRDENGRTQMLPLEYFE